MANITFNNLFQKYSAKVVCSVFANSRANQKRIKAYIVEKQQRNNVFKRSSIIIHTEMYFYEKYIVLHNTIIIKQ